MEAWAGLKRFHSHGAGGAPSRRAMATAPVPPWETMAIRRPGSSTDQMIVVRVWADTPIREDPKHRAGDAFMEIAKGLAARDSAPPFCMGAVERLIERVPNHGGGHAGPARDSQLDESGERLDW